MPLAHTGMLLFPLAEASGQYWLRHNPGTVLGDVLTELTWNTQSVVGCPCYSLALWLQPEAPGEGEKRTPAETAASQAQRQVRKAGTSFLQFLGRCKEKIRNQTDLKDLLWGTSRGSRTKCWVS